MSGLKIDKILFKNIRGLLATVTVATCLVALTACYPAETSVTDSDVFEDATGFAPGTVKPGGTSGTVITTIKVTPTRTSHDRGQTSRDRETPPRKYGNFRDSQAPPKQQEVKILEQIPISKTLLQGFGTQSYCRTDKIRSPMMNVTWESDSAGPEDLRLDVTHYGALGFARGGYVSLDIGKGARELADIVWFRERTEEEKRSNTLPNLSATEVTLTDKGGTIAIGNLTAGVHYVVRLVEQEKNISGPYQSVDTVICVADLKEVK